MTQAKIACQGVWKAFGPNPTTTVRALSENPEADSTGHVLAVRNVSLEVKAGEILVIMGLSGSGKSTLVRCLARLIEPTTGQVFVDGEDLLQASAQQMIELRRHKMGMVFQHFALLPHRTVLQNVAFPLEVQNMDKGKRQQRAQEMIALVGLKGREHYYPRELSGGQQQRVGIARSLAVEPDIWFLDEPFSALDPLIRREMQDEFLRLQSMLNKTIVFITHDFDEAIRLADRIAIMYEGEVVQLGSAEEIVTRPKTEYVAEFTRHVARDKLVSVHSIMQTITDSTDSKLRVKAEQKISEIAPMVLEHGSAVTVVNQQDQPIGSIGPAQIIATLFHNDRE